MTKVLAALIAGLLATAAYAQNPAGMSTEQGNVDNKSMERAETRKDARPAGQARTPTGDTMNASDGGNAGVDKAQAASEKSPAKRNARHPNRKMNPQGGTPGSPDAK